MNVGKVTVDVERSRWNAPLEEELFRLPYPEGTQVSDMVAGRQITVGKGDDGSGVEALMAGATKQIKMQVGPTPSTPVDQIREQDRAAATLLSQYRARIRTNAEGAVTSVSLRQFGGEPGLNSPIIGDDLLKEVAKLQMLQVLDLTHTQITDAGLKHLAPLKKLKQLSLTCTNVTDEALANLAPLTSLERLYVHNNFIKDGEFVKFVKLTDQGLANLAPLKKLSYLNVSGTGITDAGLEHLKELPKLKQLSIGHTAVTPEAIGRIREQMPTLHYVH